MRLEHNRVIIGKGLSGSKVLKCAIVGIANYVHQKPVPSFTKETHHAENSRQLHNHCALLYIISYPKKE